jgi:hypothetical protein
MPDNDDPARPDGTPDATPAPQPEPPAWQPPAGTQPGPGQAWSGWTGGPTPSGGQPGWASTPPPSAGWRTPDVKPGVVPLRPLGAGEIVDGAITTVRRNPVATLGLAAIVGVATTLVGVAASWAIRDQQSDLVDPDASVDEALDAIGAVLPVFALEGLAIWLSMTILTGLLTVVVGQAVIGKQLTISEAWSRARPRMWRLIGLTLVYSLIVAAASIGVVLVATVLGTAIGGGGGALLVVLGLLGAVVLGVWLWTRYALATPSLMLESESHHTGLRPVRIGRSLSRSATLVRGSWWRTFGILVLIMIIYVIVGWAVNIPFQLLAGAALTDPAAMVDIGFGALVVMSIGQVISTAIATPFYAAAIVLLYIDRRIRREGLDLELARAAGVDLPGRGGYGPAGPVAGPPPAP